MRTMADKLTPFTAELFGVDVSGGGLPAPVHANRVLLSSGLTASFNEATKTVTVSAAAPAAVPSWHTLANVDFTLEANQTISADGEFVLGGATFRLRHSNKYIAGSGLSNVPGSGLKLGCSDYGGQHLYHETKANVPIVSCDLSHYPLIVPGTPVRASVRTGLGLSPGTGSECYQYLGGAYNVEDDAPTQKATMGIVQSNAAVYGGAGSYWKENGLPTSLGIGTLYTLTPGEYQGLLWPEGVGKCRPAVCYRGSTSTDFAALFRCTVMPGLNADTTSATVEEEDPAHWSFELAACWGSKGSDYYQLIREFRLEAFY